MDDLAELRTAVDDTRRVVKSLMRHARTATQLLTDCGERLDHFERQLADLIAQQEAQSNGTITHTETAIVV